MTQPVLGTIGLLLLLCFARSIRGGYSGQLGALLGLGQIPLFIAVIWLLALSVRWWAIAIFVVASLLVGALIRRDNLAEWVIMQPMTGMLSIGFIGAAWGARLLL